MLTINFRLFNKNLTINNLWDTTQMAKCFHVNVNLYKNLGVSFHFFRK